MLLKKHFSIKFESKSSSSFLGTRGHVDAHDAIFLVQFFLILANYRQTIPSDNIVFIFSFVLTKRLEESVRLLRNPFWIATTQVGS